MSKGENTRTAILDEALEMTSALGLEGLTIGELASRTGLSKSGLYAHFRSKEALQIAILGAASDRVAEKVVKPALKAPRGIPRIRALFENWIDWEAGEFEGSCPFVAAAADLDDRPGPVRDYFVERHGDLLDMFSRVAVTAIECGDFRDDVDPRQFAFELWGIQLAFQQYARLLEKPEARMLAQTAFDLLIAKSRPR